MLYSIIFRFEPDPELSEIATKLWELDENRCEPGVDYEIYLQGKGQPKHCVDKCIEDYATHHWPHTHQLLSKIDSHKSDLQWV